MATENVQFLKFFLGLGNLPSFLENYLTKSKTKCSIKKLCAAGNALCLAALLNFVEKQYWIMQCPFLKLFSFWKFDFLENYVPNLRLRVY